MATLDELNHIAKLIQSEVSYFNGWSVSQETMEDSCKDAAKKIQRYLKNKEKRNEAKKNCKSHD